MFKSFNAKTMPVLFKKQYVTKVFLHYNEADIHFLRFPAKGLTEHEQLHTIPFARFP